MSSGSARDGEAVFPDPPAGRAVFRSASALVRPLTRAIDWSPLAIAALIGMSFAAVVPGEPLSPILALPLLRMAALLLGAAVGFALVDAMAVSTGAVPVPRWIRQWARTVMALTAGGLAWGATYAVVAARLAPGAVMPFPGLVVEATVCVLVGLAGSATAVRRHPGRQAALAGAVVQLALFAGTQIIGADAWPAPGDGHWDLAHAWWLAALPLPVLVLITAHRDVRCGPAIAFTS